VIVPAKPPVRVTVIGRRRLVPRVTLSAFAPRSIMNPLGDLTGADAPVSELHAWTEAATNESTMTRGARENLLNI
jgi:hypothetical protein